MIQNYNQVIIFKNKSINGHIMLDYPYNLRDYSHQTKLLHLNKLPYGNNPISFKHTPHQRRENNFLIKQNTSLINQYLHSKQKLLDNTFRYSFNNEIYKNNSVQLKTYKNLQHNPYQVLFQTTNYLPKRIPKTSKQDQLLQKLQFYEKKYKMEKNPRFEQKFLANKKQSNPSLCQNCYRHKLEPSKQKQNKYQKERKKVENMKQNLNNSCQKSYADQKYRNNKSYKVQKNCDIIQKPTKKNQEKIKIEDQNQLNNQKNFRKLNYDYGHKQQKKQDVQKIHVRRNQWIKEQIANRSRENSKEDIKKQQVLKQNKEIVRKQQQKNDIQVNREISKQKYLDEGTFKKMETINELNNKINQRIKHILQGFNKKQ